MLTGFNHAIVVPIGRSKIEVQIDKIPFKVKVFIVSDNRLSKEILIGRNILSKTGIKAISDKSGIMFTLDDSLKSKNVYEVELVDANQISPVQEKHLWCEELDMGGKAKLLTLINNYRQSVSLNTNELGKTTVSELRIELTSETPVFHRPYRFSKSERDTLNEIIIDLETNGIIRESTSPYASPAILVKKKNGEARMVVDYRQLNKITKRIQYPLPIIDDHIDQLCNKQIFTSLDLKSGFHQIPVHPDSVEKTAFITPDGQWEYLRMPFGLVNAPAVFQKTMNKVLKGSALVYIDDVLIATETLEEGFLQLEIVLKALQKDKLTLNLEKCRFFQTKIEYLGREITSEGIRPGSHKIQAISKVNDPSNVKQVRQFLGLAGYFRKFIKDFARKGPL